MSATRPHRILFVNPPSIPYNYLVKGLLNRFSAMQQVVAMPMGILYLVGVLERDLPGVEIKVVDLAKALRDLSVDPNRSEMDVESFTAKVLADQVPADWKPDWVGLSILFSTAHKSSIRIAKACKQRWADAPIVVGGMHATNAVRALLVDSPDVDYICRGEGESIVTEFAKVVSAKTDLEAIPGIIGRKKLGAGKDKDSAPLIEDLDTIPYPAWHHIKMPEYVFANYSRAKRIESIVQDGEATIVTTRGCPFHCTFCSSWTVHGREMRYRSVANVIGELEILQERYKITSVIPEDDLFSVKKPRILELCEAVTKRFDKSLYFQFPNGLSVATLDLDVITAMVKMGMRMANIAIESGSDYVQKHVIKKNCNLARARQVVQYCRDAGVPVRSYMIVGFPGESREQIQETIDFAGSLPTDWTIYSIAAPLIGTEMYTQLLDRGSIDATFNWDNAFFQDRSFDTPEIGAQELKDLTYQTNIRQNFFENYNMRIGEYERALGLWSDVLRSYAGHLVAQYCIGMAKKAQGDTAAFEAAMRKCLDMLAETENTLAHSQYKQFKHLMPELPVPDYEPGVVAIPQEGPRPGMPYKARLNL